MRSVNYAIRAAYIANLDGIVVNSIPVPVYYKTLPDDATDENYILISNVVNVDEGTKNSSDTGTSIQLQIHTYAVNGNSGKMADDIANAVFAIIYPNSQAKLNLSATGFICVSTTLTGDDVLDEIFIGAESFVTRVLTFRHYITH